MSRAATPLSPLTRAGLFTSLVLRIDGFGPITDPDSGSCARPAPGNGRRRNTAIEVTRFRCPVCEALHSDEDDAETCCPFQGDESTGLHDQDAFYRCPVCQDMSSSPREAVDCCLWRDVDAPTRWRIADAVEAGATWIEAIEVHTERITQ